MTHDPCFCASDDAQPRMVLFIGHSAMLTTVAFSPDSKTIATGSNDRSVILWDTYTGKIRNKLLGHKRNLWAVSFSPDGMTLATADWEETRLWDVPTGEVRQTLPYLTHMLKFSPDGNLLAAIPKGDIVLWNLQEKRLEHVFSSWDKVCAFSPSGAMLGMAGSREVQLWDVHTGRLIRALSIPRNLDGDNGDHEINSVTFSADSTLLAADCCGRVLVWNVLDGSVVAMLEHPKVSFVAFAPQGSTLVSFGGKSTVFWDTRTWKFERELALNDYSDRCFATSPDGELLASDLWDAKASVGLWSLRTGELVTVLRGLERSVHSISYTPDGGALVSGVSDGTIRVWDGHAGSLLRTISAFNTPVVSIAVAADAQTVAAASRSRRPDQPGELATWNLQSGERKRNLPGCVYCATTLTFSPDGRLLAAEDVSGGVGLWNVETGDLVQHLSGCGPVVFSPDGKLLAAGNEARYWPYWARQTNVWDVETGELKYSLVALHKGKSAESVTALAFSQDGKLLAIGHDCFVVTLWDVETGSMLKELAWRNYAEGVTALAFAKDGKSLAVGLPYEDDIHMWSILTGKEIRAIVGHRNNIQSLAFSPNGRNLASASSDGTIKLWNPRRGCLLATLIVLPGAGEDSVSHEWIAYAPDGRYTGSAEAERYIRWQVGASIVPAEAYADKRRVCELESLLS